MDDNPLGVFVRDARKRQGTTQRQLADAVGINFTYVCKIERGTLPHPPSVDLLRRMARALKVDFHVLLGESGRTIEIPIAYVCDMKDALASQQEWRALGRAYDIVGFLPVADFAPTAHGAQPSEGGMS